MDRSSEGTWLAIQGAFVASGACALAYEIVWGRWLATVVGSSAIATCIVLASYMGGQALGAWGSGRVSSRLARPLRAYAAVELAIAASALLFPLLADATLGLSGTTRVVSSIAILFVPTILLGATVPLALRWSELAGRPAGQTLGRLYGLNTLGACAGCLGAGFVLIPVFGLSAANAVAAVGNASIAAFVAVLASRGSTATSGDAALSAAPPSPPEAATQGARSAPRWLLDGLGFLSGFTTLGLQVVWIRLLRITLASTTYTFTLVVATFILGIGIGGLIAGRADERRAPEPSLVRAQLGLFGLLLLGWFVLPLAGARGMGSFADAIAHSVLLCVVFLLPPTVLMGFLFPTLGRLYMRRGSRASEVGRLYGVNTLGAVGGAVAATVIGIPWLGSSATYLAGVAGAGLALAAYLHLAGDALPRALRGLAAALAALLALVVLALPGWPPSYLGVGSRYGPAPEDYRILHFAEGANSTVLVDTSGGHRGIRIDGKPVASTVYVDLANQLLLGHLPALLAGEVRSGLVVGLGTGITLGALAEHDLERLVIVELESGVIAGARLFGDANGNVLDRSELEVVIDDGYNYLHSGGALFDVITSDPIQPFFRGAATLYSRDYFERAKRRLTPRGVFAHWLPLNNLGSSDFAMIARTFCAAFPYAALYWNGAEGSVLVGRIVPFSEPAVDAEQFARTRVSLARGYIESAAEVEGLLLADRAALLAWAGDGIENTVDRPLLEFTAPRSMFAGTVDSNLRAMLELRAELSGSAPTWSAVGSALAYQVDWRPQQSEDDSWRRLADALGCAEARGPCHGAEASGLLRRLGWRRALARGDDAMREFTGAGGAPPMLERGLDFFALASRLDSATYPEERSKLIARLEAIIGRTPPLPQTAVERARRLRDGSPR